MSSVSTKNGLPCEQRQTLACGVLSGVFLIAAVVLSRRVTGEVSGLSDQWLACGTGVVGIALSTCCLAVPGLLDRLSSPSVRLLAVAGCLLPALILGITLLPPGSSQGLTVLLTLYAGAVTVGLLCDTNAVSGVTVSGATVSGATVSSVLVAPTEALMPQVSTDVEPTGGLQRFGVTDFEPATAELATAELDELPVHPGNRPETTHWMSRSVQDGCDAIEGGFRIEFAPGQRQVAVHVPFSPALPAMPEIECEPIGGDAEVRVRVTSTQAYGLRIEVTRQSEFEQRQEVQLAYFASAAVQPSAVAA
jgi:hypothetical protein